MKDIIKLQNGSDIRGIALPGVPGEEVNLDEREAMAIGAAFAVWLAQKVDKPIFCLQICLGRDPRLSGDKLAKALMKGICYTGAKATYIGQASTPAMFMSTIMPYWEFDGSIMITASHLPFNRNGFKFFTAGGGLDKEDIAYILKKASRMYTVHDEYECDDANVMDMYAAHLRMLITSKGVANLKGMKIVVDAGNGSGGFFAEKVLAPLGADVSGSQFLDADGSFPNHQPNPENAEAMASICKRVVEVGADLGIIFDTDVDRSAAVTGKGEAIGRNNIVALAAALEAEEHPGGTVITDSITSNELHEFLEKDLGLKHLRFKRGYRNVINKGLELAAAGEDAFLAIETSGHAAFADNYFLDDGAYLAVLVVVAAAKLKAQGKGIEALIADLKSPAESVEYRFKLMVEDFGALGGEVLDKLTAWVEATPGLELEVPNYEGVRVNYDIEGSKGWFLLRKSLHDPVMPLNVESTEEGGLAKILPMLKEFISQFEGIDYSML